MTRQDFEKIVERRLALTRQTLIEKAKEYADDKDRLHNFHIGTMLTGRPPSEVCFGFALKHWVSIRDRLDAIVNDLDAMSSGPCDFRREVIDEKLGDAFTYLPLLEALITECRQKGEGVDNLHGHRFGENNACVLCGRGIAFQQYPNEDCPARLKDW